MDISEISLGGEFNSKNTRICVIDSIKFASVYDIICCITCTKNVSRKWSKICEKSPKFKLLPTKQFDEYGQGQRETPVANAETLCEIIFHLSGERADQYRERAGKELINSLNPTIEYAERMKELAELQVQSDDESNILTAVTVTKNIALASNPYNSITHLYVRVRYPEEYLSEITTPQKQITMDLSVIKFGITNELNERNRGYNRDELDNGFFLFYFALNTRAEALKIESILKSAFNHITLKNRKEYVHTKELAEIFNFDFDENSYESYVLLAEELFRYIIRIIKVVSINTYDNVQGFRTEIKECKRQVKLTQKQLTKVCQVINDTEIAELKFTGIKYEYDDPVISSIDATQVRSLLKHTRNELNALRKQVQSSQPVQNSSPIMKPSEKAKNKKGKDKAAQEDVEDYQVVDNDNRIKHGKIIARDIMTGEEIIFESRDTAALALNFSAHSITKTYLNQPCQLRGYHLRGLGEKIWQPPKGFHFDIDNNNRQSNEYIKAVNCTDPSDVRIYESKAAASFHLKCPHEALSLYARTKTNEPYEGFYWSILTAAHSSEWGTWVDDKTPNLCKSDYVQMKDEDGSNGRCNGKIIVRDIETGEEVTYASLNKAANSTLMKPGTLKNSYINRPRQAKGKHYRSFSCPVYWDPPSYFKFSRSKVYTKYVGFVLSEDENGEKELFENIEAASVLSKPKSKIDKIKEYLDRSDALNGKTWRRAVDADYKIFSHVSLKNDEE